MGAFRERVFNLFLLSKFKIEFKNHAYQKLYGKNNFTEILKNLFRYLSENNFAEISK